MTRPFHPNPRTLLSLGHSTVAMALDIYAHAIPTLQHDAAATIAELVTGTTAVVGA